MAQLIKVFKNQGLYTIELETGVDITSASVRRINYRRPDGKTGYWNAVLSGQTKLKYELDNNSLQFAGLWTLQAYVRIGTLDAYGEFVKMLVVEPIQV